MQYLDPKPSLGLIRRPHRDPPGPETQLTMLLSWGRGEMLERGLVEVGLDGWLQPTWRTHGCARRALDDLEREREACRHITRPAAARIRSWSSARGQAELQESIDPLSTGIDTLGQSTGRRRLAPPARRAGRP